MIVLVAISGVMGLAIGILIGRAWPRQVLPGSPEDNIRFLRELGYSLKGIREGLERGARS
jgi:hypothetical protein